jgi:hypothetical protein
LQKKPRASSKYHSLSPKASLPPSPPLSSVLRVAGATRGPSVRRAGAGVARPPAKEQAQARPASATPTRVRSFAPPFQLHWHCTAPPHGASNPAWRPCSRATPHRSAPVMGSDVAVLRHGAQHSAAAKKLQPPIDIFVLPPGSNIVVKRATRRMLARASSTLQLCCRLRHRRQAIKLLAYVCYLSFSFPPDFNTIV